MGGIQRPTRSHTAVPISLISPRETLLYTAAARGFGLAKQIFAKPRAQLVPNTPETDNAEKVLAFTIRTGRQRAK